MKMTEEIAAQELKKMYGFCSGGYNQDNGEEMSERLTQLSIYLARSAVVQGNAQYFLDLKQGIESELTLKNVPGVTPSMLTKIVAGKCANEMKLLKLAERLNRTITHQIDALRSQLSYLKNLPH